MNACAATRCLLCVTLLAITYESGAQASDGTTFVRGGQFKDLILPMPIIDGLESEGLWGGDNVLPRDKENGIEDNKWCYWGGNPVRGHDGKYHIAICRWPENTGHHGWFESEVAHCVSDNPIGPYKVTKTIVTKGHNPEVLKLPDGNFALHTSDTSVYQASRMAGPWKRVGHIRINSRGFRDSDRVGSNLTTEYRPDGSILIMKKDGDVAVSRTGVTGPYQMVAAHNYARATGYPEDPVIWRSRHQYHAIYNHAQDRKSAYMRSLDGIHWRNEAGLPYDVSTTFYTDGSRNEWYKFERPKILQDDLGRATHLSLAIMDVSKGADKGNDNHSSKNLIMPLVTEKLIAIVGDERITPETRQMTLRIEAEPGFDPQRDLDVDSLRFGSDSVVNVGGGCQAIETQPQGKDLLVTFEGVHGLNHRDYDFKLIGQTVDGALVVGYALLPGRSATEASLIALPVSVKEVDGQAVLSSAVENWGLETSDVCQVVVLEHNSTGEHTLQSVEVPPIEPYATWPLSVPLSNADTTQCEYRLVLIGDAYRDESWQYVDDLNSNVEFSGGWQEHPQPDAAYFMGNEHVSSTLGDEVTLRFHGTRARAYGRIGRGMGSYAVYVDGEYIETIRCNWGPIPRSKLYQTNVLPNGLHTLRLVKVETDFNGEVSIDAFAYESPR